MNEKAPESVPEVPTSPRTLASLQTPCLLLDAEKMHRNIERLRNRLAGHRVAFRPHLKTAKSIEVARLMMSNAAGPATVSTLREAECFASEGVTDLLYAVGLTPVKIERVVALRNEGVDLCVVVDSVRMASVVAAASARATRPIPVLIEVDCGDRRGGVSLDEPQILIETGRTLVQGGAQLRGVMIHAGMSYECRSASEIEAVAETERRVAAESAQILRAAGLPCDVVSVGSTPTALFAKDLSGVTEVRAGVFVFFDLVMAGLGVCNVSDISLSVLATVIGKRPEGTLVVDAGWMAMSRDRGTAKQAVDQGYGIVCDASGKPYPDLLLLDVNQEHGMIGLRPGSTASLPDLNVGDLVRILPNHACATAAQHDVYHVVKGADPKLEAIWPRIRGW